MLADVLHPARVERERRPLDTDRQELAEKYLPLARALAHNMSRTWPEIGDEFESAAHLALVEAAECYDAERNIRFSTYARHRIRWALRDVQRQMLIPAHASDGDATMPLSWSDAVEQSEIPTDMVDGCELLRSVEALDEVEAMLSRLPQNHARACREIYVRGRNQGEAADVLGLSKSRLSFIHHEALRLLGEVWRPDEERTGHAPRKAPKGHDGSTLDEDILEPVEEFPEIFPR